MKQTDVSSTTGPYGGLNPPPNRGAAFVPPLASGLAMGPAVAQIVKPQRDGAHGWTTTGRNWTSFVTWNLADHDVAIIDTSTLSVTYASGMLSTVMALALRPDGAVTPVGLDAHNEIRFQSNVQSRFVHVAMGAFSPAAPGTTGIVDLNPHLLYDVASIPQPMRDLSIGDPRGIVWHPTSGRAYVSGMGSNNVIVTDAAGNRYAEITVGQGPTGLAISPDGSRVYSVNKFDASVSAIDTSTNTETARVHFFDPTPSAIKLGRPLLYDTHATSGLGQASCASCHIDARIDALAWDLGDPTGAIKQNDQTCFAQFVCTPWHPMKGPMVTQSLQSIVGTEPFHWRGDRENVAAFAPAFTGLQGADIEPTAAQLTQLTNFIATIKYPPNPNRTLSDSTPSSFPTAGGTTGSPQNGQNVFQNFTILGSSIKCVTCHALPYGTSRTIDDAVAGNMPQSMKMAQLRNLYRKRGFDRTSQQSARGFGYNHDSEYESIDALLRGENFNFLGGPAGDQQRHDLEAYLDCFPTDTHPAMGQQVFFDGTNNTDPAAVAKLAMFVSYANSSTLGLIAKGRRMGEDRGWAYLGANAMQSDRQGEQITVDNLRLAAASGNEITFMAVPQGTQNQLGIDRDGDGFYDADEHAACSNPNDPASYPGARGNIDVNGSLSVNVQDIFDFLSLWFAGDPRANLQRRRRRERAGHLRFSLRLVRGLLNLNQSRAAEAASVFASPPPSPRHEAPRGCPGGLRRSARMRMFRPPFARTLGGKSGVGT